MYWDIIGYIGTALVLGSFLIENVFYLRLINLLGSIVWLSYGIGLWMMPQIVVNSCIIVIHSIWFIKTLSSKDPSKNPFHNP